MAQIETIAIDIDDVLAANAEGFARYSNEQWGHTLTAEDYDEHWATVWSVGETEAERRAEVFHESGVVADYAHFDEAKAVLGHLAADFRLIVVTSRRKQIADITHEWIGRHFPDTFDDVIFAGFFDEIAEDSHRLTKADICQKIGASYLVDDQLKHCVAAASIGIRAVLFGNYKWNASNDLLPDGITRAKDWTAVQEYFDSRG